MRFLGKDRTGSIPFCTSNHLSDACLPSLLCSLFSWLFLPFGTFQLMERLASQLFLPARGKSFFAIDHSSPISMFKSFNSTFLA
jgi:hypothetical protein